MLAAADSSGYLVCEIPVPEVREGVGTHPLTTWRGKTTESTVKATIVTKAISLWGGENRFKIIHTGMSAPSAASESLMVYLVKSYFDIESLGLDVSGRREWPVEVTIRGLKGDTHGRFVRSCWSHSSSTLEFDNGHIWDFDRTRQVVASELAHLLLSLYDPRGTAECVLGLDPDHLWLNVALATWLGIETSGSIHSHFYLRSGNRWAPFEGMQKGAALDPRAHGYGMSAMIEYFSKRPQWSSMMGTVYREIKGGTHPVRAILNHMGDPVNWYPFFLGQYMSGSVYDDFYTQEVVTGGGLQGKFEIRSEEDNDTTFAFDYPDLSARVYGIDIDDPFMDPSSSLNLAMRDGSASIGVFTYDKYSLPDDRYGRNIQFLASEIDRVSIEDVADLYIQDRSILVLVTNNRYVYPYTSESDMSLTIQLSQGLPYTHCYFNVDVGAESRYVSGGYEETRYPVLREEIHGYGEGSFDGITFVGSWDIDSGQGSSREGMVSVDLNADADSLFHIFATEITYLDGQASVEWSFRAENMPRDYESSGELGFILHGDDACEHLTILEYERGLQSSEWSETLVEWFCDSGSDIKVYFDMGD
jgi:hypothetical protein